MIIDCFPDCLFHCTIFTGYMRHNLTSFEVYHILLNSKMGNSEAHKLLFNSLIFVIFQPNSGSDERFEMRQLKKIAMYNNNDGRITLP